MRCKNFAKGTCQHRECTLAHEGDGYNYLIEFRKLHREKRGLVEPAVERDMDDEEGDGESTLAVP